MPGWEADSERSRHPAAGPVGAWVFGKGSCDSHRNLQARSRLEWCDARLWKAKPRLPAPCFRLGIHELFRISSGGL